MAISTFFMASAAFSAGKAKVHVTATHANASLKLLFKTEPAEGLEINAEGPWKLDLKSAGPLIVGKQEWKRSDWKSEMAGFEVPAEFKGKESAAEITYKMTVFVCTKDHTQCYREVIDDKAKVTW